jgi:hypothetical protein
METVSPERKRWARSHFCSGREPWREGEAPAEPHPCCSTRTFATACHADQFKGSAGASPSRVFAAAIRRLIKRIASRMQVNHEGGPTERTRNLSRCRRILSFPCPEPSW